VHLAAIRSAAFLIDRQIAYAVVLHLACDDAQNGALPFGVMVPEIRGHDCRAAERATTLARCLAIGRPRALARREATPYAPGELAERSGRHGVARFGQAACGDRCRTAGTRLRRR